MKTITQNLKLLLSLVVISSSTVAFLSCSSSDDGGSAAPQGKWNDKPFSYASTGRSGSIAFKIGDIVYVGMGLNATGVNENFLKDIYKYDNGWGDALPIKEFPDTARSSAVAFVINGKAYVGLGYDGKKYRNDFYEYDPATTEWTKKKDFPGTSRAGATAFSIDNIGYVGGGYNINALLDFWSYNPETDEWESKSAFKEKRQNAFSFVIDGKGYIGGGTDEGVLVTSFVEYDPVNNKWTDKNDLIDDNVDQDANDKGYTIARELASTFVIEGKGYVVGGARSSTSLDKETWQYTPASDSWIKMDPFPASGRIGTVGYSIGNIGYVGLGRSGGLYYDKIYSFDPAATQ